MNGVAAEGWARGSVPRRWVEAIAEALRERRSERRARAAARLGAAPLRIRRAALAAALDARLAVRAGVALDDFLRHRLARYAAKLPVTLDALPATVDVEAGDVMVRARRSPRRSRSTSAIASTHRRAALPRAPSSAATPFIVASAPLRGGT